MNIFPDNISGLSSGEVAPTGYFDPLGLSNGKDAATLKQWRQAELKHGRVAMLAAVGLLTQEITSIIPSVDAPQGPAIHHLELLDDKFPEFGELVSRVLMFYTILHYTILTMSLFRNSLMVVDSSLCVH